MDGEPMLLLCYLIHGKLVDVETADFQEALKKAYHNKIRPLCPCREPPIPMYIAKVNGHFIVKRMPNTGSDHDLECKSYEIPTGLSGLDQVLGSAIKENNEDGLTTLRFDFALSKGAPKAVPTGKATEKNGVKTDGKKLGLRGLLHYLWEQAEFNKWSPGMAGKRNWFIVRKYLYAAAKGKTAKNLSLDSLLFIPEVFDLDHQADINKRRQMALKQLHEIGKPQPFMLVIAEVKDIAKARFGHKMVLKHLPDFPILLNDDIYSRMNKHFAVEFDLWSANDHVHLMVIGTFGINASGIASFQEIAVMPVNEQWLPYENNDELKLINSLIQSNRRFIKCLRYNLPSSIPKASVILADNDNETTAIFIRPHNASDDFEQDVQAMIEGNGVKARIWRDEDGKRNSIDFCRKSL
jgi:Protein of unknown function (DUF1173)